MRLVINDVAYCSHRSGTASLKSEKSSISTILNNIMLSSYKEKQQESEARLKCLINDLICGRKIKIIKQIVDPHYQEFHVLSAARNCT